MARPLNILLADGNVGVLECLTKVLIEWGHKVQAVANSREALKRIADGSGGIDLVIAERNLLGGVFGENVVNVVEAAKQKGMKAILMSAEDLHGLAVTAAVSGADRILPKPFDFGYLRRIIEELFGK